MPEVQEQSQPQQQKTSAIDNVMEQRLQQYDRVMGKARELFSERNREYSDTISVTGVLGACVEIVGVASRLKPLVIKAADRGQSKREKVANVLLDLINYGVIAAIMMMVENWDGE